MKSGANVNKMKPTAQRLSEVYCRPTTEGECKLLGIEKVNIGYDICQSWRGGLARYIDKGRTQIPVSRFIDLIQDAICAWRLEQDGFKVSGDDRIFSMNAHTDVFVTDYGIFMRARDRSDEVEVWCNGVKTYTQLLTLIELIG